MMRKVFGGAMAFSMVGAVVLGGVLAWSNSHSYNLTSQVGLLQFSLTHTQTASRIGPDNDNNVVTDNGIVTNTGGSNGFDIAFDTGSVTFTDVTSPVGGGSDQANCGVAWFAGDVQDQSGGKTLLASSGVPADQQGNYAVVVRVHPGAPTACEGDSVSYRVTINEKTVNQGS